MTPKALRARLFLMMLFEYAILGAWSAVAGKYFTDPAPRGLGFEGAFSGLLFSLLPLGSILSPVLIGQLADRWIRSERLLGWLCLLCSGLLLAISSVRDQTHILWLMLGYSLLFGPTITLTNAIALAHLKDASKEFGKVRVGGTLGWFVALGILSVWRATAQEIVTGDLFLLSGAFAAVLGVYSFSLPATRPSETAGGVPFFQALALLRDRNFLLFGVCSFVLGLTLDFYYIFMSAFLGTPRSLGGVGLASGAVPLMMMLPQVSEIVVMSTLGATLPRLGIKRALLIGFGAWIARFVILALNPTIAAAGVALLLHGFCFVFVFAVASLYVNEVAHSDIRASAQALVTIGLFGFGRFFGSQLAGRVHDSFTRGEGVQKITNWPAMYMVACGMAITAAFGLAIFFREPKLRAA